MIVSIMASPVWIKDGSPRQRFINGKNNRLPATERLNARVEAMSEMIAHLNGGADEIKMNV